MAARCRRSTKARLVPAVARGRDGLDHDDDVIVADLSPPGLVALGPVLAGLGVIHFKTAFWWYDTLSPRWRDSAVRRSSALLNRWGGAGFLVFVGVATTVTGISR